jgi:hypothetical protein
MSRLGLGAHRQHQGAARRLSLQGTAVASDAFFPFRDGLDVVVDAGATCVIQPGGSMRDEEVIDAADERGVALVCHRSAPHAGIDRALPGRANSRRPFDAKAANSCAKAAKENPLKGGAFAAFARPLRVLR